MSLLIKALDHLDKNKQAEKSKKLTGEYVADEALMLELMPVESKQTAEPQQAVEEKPEFSEIMMVESSSADSTHSLEDEAGITGGHITAPKITKPKLGAANAKDSVIDKAMAKPSVQAATVKNIPSAAQLSNTTTDQIKKYPALQNATTELNQKAATKVFVANKAIKTPSSKSALVLLGLAGALLIWLGLQGYSYIKKMTAPDVIAPAELPAEMATPNQENQSALDESDVNISVGNKTSASAVDNKVLEKPNMREDVTESEPKKPQAKTASNGNDEIYSDSDASYNPEPQSNAKRKPLKLTSKEASSGVDPTLMAAYVAYTRGDDATAQQLYRQVLQRDVRNVDALLGMAAIAQRQGRDADASSWYYKVLEIEPKNTIAQSVMMGAESAGQRASPDVVRTESRMKNMLAQQPDSANAHAALGNLYAAQGQWSLAQQAYFNASRLAPENADYAFNLAISLDQMGKASLALQQYERALELLNKSGGVSPDRSMLEARIHALR